MSITITPTTLASLRPALETHMQSLVSPVDSFLEEHLLASCYYQIADAGQVVGWTAVHNNSLLTQFFLIPAYRHLGQRIFQMVRKLDQVQSAFVPTCDEFFLAHALDDVRRIEKQAYFFQVRPDALPFSVPAAITMRSATLADAPTMTQQSGDFFDRLDERIAAQQIFVAVRDAVTVGYGIIEEGILNTQVASVGMFVRDEERRQGVGTAIIVLMMDEARRRNRTPIAGCWYYNHRSKKTLEKAGLYSQTRLLKIDL